MEFKFDAHQEYQLEAVAAVVDLFSGLAKFEEAFTLGGAAVRANPQSLDWNRVLENLQQVQRRNGLPVDTNLVYLEGTAEVEDGNTVPVLFPNFAVEMETGTGKTYVYLRTALELYTRYGFRKFIVVVPSVAVREGVLKTLQVTDRHFRTLYQNPPFRYYAYDSGKLSLVRGFAQSDGLEIMVMTIQSFQSERTVLRQERDQLHGARPIHLVQATRPILILDEPQNMESEDRIRALLDLNPLFALRYSATHRNLYNLVYRLTPLDAYKRGLVKKIEVAGLVEAGGSQPYIELVEVRRAARRIEARLRVHRLAASGVVTLREITVRSGDDLQAKTNNPLYRGYQVDEVNTDYVSFTNGSVVYLGQAVGPDREAIFRAQIRYTIETHLFKQRQLKKHGIKVLSLFFVDQVKSYVGENGSEGLVKRLFREEFEAVTRETAYSDWQDLLPSWRGKTPENLQAAYFAQKTKKNGVSYFEEESSKEAREAFQQAYQLIMREKERLLSFDEPVAFIFSHSALREGWDNPNIFQICTLNQTGSLVRKRQEIGRGVRLCVNQNGERVFNQNLNRLTVVANQSYEDYARQLQEEFREDEIEGYKPSEAPKKPGERSRDTYRRTKDLTDPLFLELWDAIKHRTRYRVSLDSERLIRDVVNELDNIEIHKPHISLGKVVLEAEDGELTSVIAVSPREYYETSRPSMPNMLELISELLQRSSPPVRLTRRTILEILRQTKNPGLTENPYGFASVLVQVLKQKLAEQLAEGIRYEKTGQWYEASQIFLEEFSAYVERIKREANGKPLAKSLYEGLEVDSEVEEQFADQLELDPRVLFYVKLPRGFTVPTPLGNYIPDWAVLIEERDLHGIPMRKLYLVQETKATENLSELLPAERHKVLCGRAHFAALGVKYAVGPNLKV